MGDALIVMRKELKEIMALGGAYRGRFQLVLLLGVLGIVMPLQMGAEWVTSPAVVALWGWVPLMLVGTVVADSFAGERERHTLETLLASRLSDTSILFGKIAAAVAYGWSLTLAALLLGLVSVNLAHRGNGLLFFHWTMALAAVSLSFLGAGMASAAGVLVSLRAQTVRQAQQTLNIAMMLLFFVPMFGVRALPETVRQRLAVWAVHAGSLRLLIWGAAVLVAVDIVLIVAARARFRRPRLVES